MADENEHETQHGHKEETSTARTSAAETKDEPKAPSRKSTNTTQKKDGAPSRNKFVYPPQPTTGKE